MISHYGTTKILQRYSAIENLFHIKQIVRYHTYILAWTPENARIVGVYIIRNLNAVFCSRQSDKKQASFFFLVSFP